MIKDDLTLFGLIVYRENMRESLDARAKRMRGILEKTKKRGYSAKTLLKQFGVTQKTISRDIRKLRDKKLLYISEWKDNKIPLYRSGSRPDIFEIRYFHCDFRYFVDNSTLSSFSVSVYVNDANSNLSPLLEMIL